MEPRSVRLSAVTLLAFLGGVAVPALASSQPAPETERSLTQIRRLLRPRRPAAAVAALLARLDAEAARATTDGRVAAAVHEALVVLTAHDPVPERALDGDESWRAPAARQQLARAWHASTAATEPGAASGCPRARQPG